VTESTITWREVLAESTDRLGSVTGSPAIEARWIVERASGFEGAEHVTMLDEPVTQRAMYFHDLMVERRLQGEPLQYVLGRWGFRTLDLMVDRRVLIPRPETEVVTGLALAELDRIRSASAEGTLCAVDLGTGSGAIGLSIAVERERIDVWLTDRSAEALEVARANLTGIGRAATRVRVVEGSWFEALPVDLLGAVDLVVSNPPYVADPDELDVAVRDWEPAAALFAGPDGLDDLRVLVSGASEWLRPEGALVLEIDPRQAEAVTDLARSCGFGEIAVHRDLSGRDRAVVARR